MTWFPDTLHQKERRVLWLVLRCFEYLTTPSTSSNIPLLDTFGYLCFNAGQWSLIFSSQAPRTSDFPAVIGLDGAVAATVPICLGIIKCMVFIFLCVFLVSGFRSFVMFFISLVHNKRSSFFGDDLSSCLIGRLKFCLFAPRSTRGTPPRYSKLYQILFGYDSKSARRGDHTASVAHCLVHKRNPSPKWSRKGPQWCASSKTWVRLLRCLGVTFQDLFSWVISTWSFFPLSSLAKRQVKTPRYSAQVGLQRPRAAGIGAVLPPVFPGAKQPSKQQRPFEQVEDTWRVEYILIQTIFHYIFLVFLLGFPFCFLLLASSLINAWA